MCACEPGYVCSKCADTPHDFGYFLDEQDEPDPVPAGQEVDGRWEDWR